MARYEHLPIYKQAMDLAIYFEKIVRNFSRYQKYTLGSELRDKSRAIVGLIIKANKEVQTMYKKESYVVSAAIVMAIAVMIFFPLTGTAGSLDPGTTPAPTMKTLDQIPPTWSTQLPASTRFVVLADFNNQAVLDKETGLVWEQSPSKDTFSWWDAFNHCHRFAIGGRKGWRLPMVQELASLVDNSRSDPALPVGHPFSNVQSSYYWSAYNDAYNFSNAWLVFFYDGDVLYSNKNPYYNAWCVRGGQGVNPQ